LLRLTYMGSPLSQLPTGDSKYIKIESIGLEGNVDTDDPTTYTAVGPSGPTRMSAIVAYKPIGLPDYVRFFTNKNRLPGPAVIGVNSIYNSSAGLVTPGVYDFQTGPPSTGTDIRFPTAYPIITTIGNPSAYVNPISYVNSSGTTVPGGTVVAVVEGCAAMWTCRFRAK